MSGFSPRQLTLAAMTAAVYGVLGYFGDLFGLNFGPVQVRFAEALSVLPFLLPATAPGLAVGCLITNLLSPYGPADVVLGTLATALAARLTARASRWYLAPLPPILLNLLLLPPMWAWQQTGTLTAPFWSAWAMHSVTFAVGQTIACYGLGTLLLRLLTPLLEHQGRRRQASGGPGSEHTERPRQKPEPSDKRE